MIVRHFIEQLIVDQSLDCHLVERNLYKVFLSICDEKRITDKASDMVEKQCDKHHENSKNQEMLAIVTELILTPNEESGPQAPVSYEEALGGTEVGAEEEVEPEPVKDENLEKLVAEDMD